VFEIRIHGRGGQGVVTAAELLSVAAFDGGRHAQAFPTFGSERMGAPVVSFVRVAEAPIRIREPVLAPDALLVQDATLLQQVDVFSGLAADGYLLVNTSRTAAELGITEVVARLRPDRVVTLDASGLALQHVGRNVPNVPLLGGFVALTGLIELDAVHSALRQRFSAKVAEANVAAATAAYEEVAGRLAALRERALGAQTS
jgi:pyruvate ferredoxin oxidoreductase gamma subunit